MAGWAVAKGFLPASLATPDVQAAVVVILAAVATYIFPANKAS